MWNLFKGSFVKVLGPVFRCIILGGTSENIKSRPPHMMRERVLSSVCALGRHVGVQGEEAVVAEVRNVKIRHGPPDPPSLPPSPAAAAYYLPRHLAPSPTYPHLYPPYLIRGYPDTAALENRQTIINDYITSQQMHHNAASAMAQRADMLRGLSPRESSLALNYAAGPRGELPGAVRISRDLSCAVVCKRRVHTCALQLGGGAQLAGRTRGACWLLGGRADGAACICSHLELCLVDTLATVHHGSLCVVLKPWYGVSSVIQESKIQAGCGIARLYS